MKLLLTAGSVIQEIRAYKLHTLDGMMLFNEHATYDDTTIGPYLLLSENHAGEQALSL